MKDRHIGIITLWQLTHHNQDFYAVYLCHFYKLFSHGWPFFSVMMLLLKSQMGICWKKALWQWCNEWIHWFHQVSNATTFSNVPKTDANVAVTKRNVCIHDDQCCPNLYDQRNTTTTKIHRCICISLGYSITCLQSLLQFIACDCIVYKMRGRFLYSLWFPYLYTCVFFNSKCALHFSSEGGIACGSYRTIKMDRGGMIVW